MLEPKSAKPLYWGVIIRAVYRVGCVMDHSFREILAGKFAHGGNGMIKYNQLNKPEVESNDPRTKRGIRTWDAFF